MSDWWPSFFDDEYASYGLSATDPMVIGRTLDFLIEALELKPGMRVFDQCCGIGRISMPLAERGMSIIGVDQSRSYINKASQQASARGLPCQFSVGDAFEFIANPVCDAAIN